MTTGVVGVVLAAGPGTRYRGPTPKLLALLGGVPVVRRAVEAGLAAGLDEVLVVTGAVELQAVLPDAVRLVRNPRWRDGLATSLAAACDDLAPTGCTDVVVGLGDAPLVSAAAWAAVAAERSTPLAVATYLGHRGHPVRIARELWRRLPREGDVGARELMAREPSLVREVPCTGRSDDLDTADDLVALQRVADEGGATPWS